MDSVEDYVRKGTKLEKGEDDILSQQFKAVKCKFESEKLIGQ